MTINSEYWLAEQDAQPDRPDPMAGGPPLSQPGTPQNPMNQPQQSPDNPPIDISDDPQYPDIPEREPELDFHIWKINYVKESIKGDPNVLVQQLLSVRTRELEPIQSKFVEDNLDINWMRQNSNIMEASKEIRNLIKKQFDRTYPAGTLVKHITEILDQQPLLNEVYLKLAGCGEAKGGYHRKFIGSLLGAVQVGSGGQNEDLIFEEQDYSIRISTRFNSRWGDVTIGTWSLHEDDPHRFLKSVEYDRLEGGSPEEKDVLRRRIVMESIAAVYMQRAFVINVVGTDGTVQHLAWDLGNSLKAAYLEGKLVVRTFDNDEKQAFINEDGSIVSIPNMSIYYVKEAQSLNANGKPEIEEIEFISYRDGVLYLAAQLDLVKEASQTLQGMFFKDTLFQGNPTDVAKVMRCIPRLPEILLRKC